MSTNDVSVTALGLNKRPVSHKHQVHSHSPTTGKSRADEFRVNRTMTAMNRPLSKLPNGRVKTSFYSSTLGFRSQEKDSFTTLPSKIDRQSTTIDAEIRLPVVYSLMNDHDQRRMSEFRRRQIYALNHFMRDLEQEQFRQFCQTHEINSVNKNEDIK